MSELALAADYSTRQAAALAGLPYMTIDRWERAGIITSEVAANGYGTRRRWSAADVERLCRIGDVYRQARTEGLLVSWETVGRIWDGLVDGAGWSVTLAA